MVLCENVFSSTILTVSVEVNHADGHQQRMPIELYARCGRPTKAAQIDEHPAGHQNNDRDADHLGDEIQQTEIHQFLVLTFSSGFVHFNIWSRSAMCIKKIINT